MTQLAFHFNAADKLAYTCRLLRKATASGARLSVTGSAEVLARLDQELWTFSATEFLPHCGIDASAGMLQKTPIVLTQALHATPNQDLLVNLGEQIPAGFEGFARIIEVVSQDDNDRRLARLRWKQYVKYGLHPAQHDLDLKVRP